VWRKIRIAILLFILATVAQSAWLARSRTAEWRTSLRVVVYPINGDASATSARYIPEIGAGTFEAMRDFFAREGEHYGVAPMPPIDLFVAPAVSSLPPPPPVGNSTVSIMAWSLRLRNWAYWHDTHKGPKPDVRVFVLYYDPALRPKLPHSTGLQKGQLGVVHAFADAEMDGSNNIVIAHEVLHTLGATDKYVPASNQPLFPDGYAEPEAQPLHPQKLAEIMAGRIAISLTRAETPRSLKRVVIGAKTAREINWVK
jgi:hypothetical protein